MGGEGCQADLLEVACNEWVAIAVEWGGLWLACSGWQLLLYMPSEQGCGMTKAKVFRNNRSQAVRLPKEFRFGVGQVFVRRVGRDVVLSAWPVDWSGFLESGRVASSEFLKAEADETARVVVRTGTKPEAKAAPKLDRWGLPLG